MGNDNELVERAGVERRSVLTAAVWSVPVVAAVASTPLAAASAVGFDLFTEGLQRGDGTAIFNADATLKYVDGFADGFTLLNHGPQEAPAGTIVTMRYDNRIITPGDFTFSQGSPANPQTPLSYSAPVVNGNESTVTFVIPVPVPVEEDVFGPGTIWIFTQYDLDIQYPNDALDDYRPLYWQVLTSDDDSSNNSFGSATATTVPANSPWGLQASATFTRYTTSACEMELPTAVTVTSVGPGSTPGDVTLNLSLEAFAVTGVTLGGLTVNGVPTAATVDSTGSGTYAIALGRPLGAGDVVEASFSYTVDATAALVSNGRAQFSANSAGLGGGQDQRLTINFADGDNSACAL
jgi:hypothetical protein